MRTLRLLALLIAVAAPVLGQSNRTAHFAIGYDVASTTMTYCTMNGQRDDPWADPRVVNIPIETSGSSMTVTAVTASSAPFAALAAGDAIFVQTAPNTREVRWITAKSDDDEVTVNANIDLSAGFNFQWLDLVCATGDAAGWVSIERFSTVSMTVLYEAGDLTGLDVVWECKDNSLVSKAVQVYPGPKSECGFGTLNTNVCTYATLGDRQTVSVDSNPFSFCRLGLAYRTADGGTTEAVHGVIVGRTK